MNNLFLISEVGINHNGSLEIAKKLIDLSISGGAKYVKFQKRCVEECYTKDFLDSLRESQWGKTQRDQKLGLEFTLEQYQEIDSYCKEKNIEWFCSVWDNTSTKFIVDNFKTPFIKIPSALNTDNKLIDCIKETQIPVIISTGMSTKKEIDNLINKLGNQIKYILSCVSCYPCPDELINLNKILTLKKEYGNDFEIGYSNHSSGILYIIAAAVLGVSCIEYHLTLDRSMAGSDQASSIEKNGVLKIKDYLNSLNVAWGDGNIECIKQEIPIMKKLRRYS